jgi:transcriptional regulator of nitric oxide reductase
VFSRTSDGEAMKFRSSALSLLRNAGVAAVLLAAIVSARADQISPEELQEAFPGAQQVGPFEDQPPAARVYRDGKLAGYVFYSNGAVPAAGYTGKPINILVGLGLDGIVTGARLIEHHEPILAIGVQEATLRRFIDSHRGLDIRNPVRPTGAGGSGLDAISGATVSSLVMNDTIVRSARAVARSRGILGAPAAGMIDLDFYEPVGWTALLADGSIAHRRVERPAEGDNAPAVIVDLYVTLANPARIGRNLLGDKTFSQVMAALAPQDAVILIGANGLYSFKGTAFVRTGVFDRIRIAQGGRQFPLQSEKHRRIDVLANAEAPEFREIGLFTIPAASGFEIAKPWSLELSIEPPHQGGTVPAVVEIPFRLPDKYFSAPETPATAPEPQVTEPIESARKTPAPPEISVPAWLASDVRLGLLALSALIFGLLALLSLTQHAQTRRGGA